MRDLKFRAFADGAMHYGGFSVHATAGKLSPDMVYIKESDPLMQYTGLQDRNGVDIYEGDIVAITDRPALRQVWSVEFQDGAFQVYNQLNSFRRIKSSVSEMCLVGNVVTPVATFVISGDEEVICEILGNVYQNPELMEG